MSSENQSEVARLLDQIRLEYEAGQCGFLGFAQVGKHAFITARMEHISALADEIEKIVPDKAWILITNMLSDPPEVQQ